jgi:hypothetical protein
MKLKALVFLAACVAANAGTAATRAEQKKACEHDAIKYCAVHIPNKQKIEACMKAHYDKLSPACQAMFDAPDDGEPDEPASQPSS